jgi:predicted CXXCH cytochrome family protein
MKKLIAVVFAIAMLATFGAIAMADTVPGSGIDRTWHDMSSTGLGGIAGLGEAGDHGAGGLNRICIYCHAPHNTVRPDALGGWNTYRPLWNHEASANTTGYTMYSNDGGSGDAPGDLSHQSQAMAYFAMNGTTHPGSVSLLCLSCHDGTMAVSAYGLNAPVGPGHGTNPAIVSARAQIGLGGDLSNHHPIGFNYNTAQASDNELNADTAAGYLTDGVYGANNLLHSGPNTIAQLMWNGNMECTSCHDVHNTKNGGVKFTWVQDQNSRLCLTCHLKGVAQYLSILAETQTRGNLFSPAFFYCIVLTPGFTKLRAFPSSADASCLSCKPSKETIIFMNGSFSHIKHILHSFMAAFS